MTEIVTLARSSSTRGEIVLRRRDGDHETIYELIVNGAFAMDSRETLSERELAAVAYAENPATQRILIGGLGLGFTTATVLVHDPVRVDVVEIEDQLVAWALAGHTPTLKQVAQDRRVHLQVGDIHQVLTDPDSTPPGPWDAILLDVDNGPDFLIHADNSRLYRSTALKAAHSRLAPGGVLAIWCQGAAPALLAELRALDPGAKEHVYQVNREGRTFAYVIYSVRMAS